MAASSRQSAAPYYLIALLAFSGVGIALLSQHVFSIPPCAWCVLQRLIFIVLGVFSLVAGVLRQLGHQRSSTVASLLGLATSVGGILAAGTRYRSRSTCSAATRPLPIASSPSPAWKAACLGYLVFMPPAWMHANLCWGLNTLTGAWRYL
ncbi:disulfide bond formation protein B [Alcaligenes sp. HPC1271]|nr:disulfide bond formation protein B [Alcaligenes sp. HPC1271]